MNNELYACLYVREFPAQALMRLKPELLDRPCAVVEGEPPLQRVRSLNTKARLLGIEHGMTRVELGTFPASAVLARSLQSEAETRAAVLECAAEFSPRIEDRSADAALIFGLDIAGMEKLFGPPEILAKRLLKRVRGIGISTRVVISSNFETALRVAKNILSGRSIQIIAQGDEAATLSPLPLSVLNFTEQQAETFAAWGIHTLGMLAALPERELIARIGQGGRRLQELARGECEHLFQPREGSIALEEQMELDSPIELLDSLLFVVGVMLDRLIMRAKERILALASVTITLALEGGASHARTVRPALPTTEKQFWIKLLHLDLEAHPPQKAIVGVVLRAEAGQTSKVQTGLFSPPLPEPARLDVTLALIRKIVGDRNVGRAVLEDSHAPDGFRLEPFTLDSGENAPALRPQPRAALRMLRPPEIVSVTLKGSSPTAFSFRNQRYTIERAYGPWIADGGWWSDSLWAFKQWDLVARTREGSLLCCCITHDLAQDQWQMVALYD